MKWTGIYYIVSLGLMIISCLYGKYLPEAIQSVVFKLLIANLIISFLSLMIFNPRRGAKPYLICGKCNNVFPYPENRFGGGLGRSSVYREYCPYCEKDRLCYIRFFRKEEEK